MIYNIEYEIDGELIQADITTMGLEAAAIGLEFNPKYFVGKSNNTTLDKLEKLYEYISEKEQAVLRRVPITEMEENAGLEEYGIRFVF